MELRDLQPFVIMLIIIGMVLGIGVLIFDKFSDAVPTTTRTNDSITDVLNGSNTHEASYGNFTGTPDIILYNNTGETIDASLYSFTENASNGNRAYLQMVGENNNSITADEVWVLYSHYDYNTPTRSSLIGTRDEINNITTNWIGLLVTVVILAMILVIVISSFGAGVRR